MYSDLVDADLHLFGTLTHSMHVTGRRVCTGGERLDDMAQAWIEGRHDEVLAWDAERKARLRMSRDTDTPVAKPARYRYRYRGKNLRDWSRRAPKLNALKIKRLRERGWLLKDIAKRMGASVDGVAKAARREK